MKLTVVLGASQEASFDISLNDNSFTYKWVEELRWCLSNSTFNQHEAFAQLLTLDDSVDILTNSCKTINKYLKDYIEIRPNIKDQPQEYFNYLHTIFEQFTGKWGEQTRLFAIAPKDLKDAIRNLNFYIHRVETRTESMPDLYISFNKDYIRRQEFSIDDYDFFKFEIPAGTLFCHYAEVGKEFIDLYEDNLPIDYAGLATARHYTGEATLIFFDYDTFSDLGYKNWLQTQGIDPYNKLLGHGMLPLGIVDNLTDAMQKIKQYRHIHSIIIKE